MIPVPIEVNNTFLWINDLHQFLWVDQNNASHALVTASQMDNCKSHDNNKICEFEVPVRSTSYKSCEFFCTYRTQSMESIAQLRQLTDNNTGNW